MIITTSDAWLVSVKNRIREYAVAANSIFLLPVAQQDSAKEFVKRTDKFIRERLFPILREMAKARNVELYEKGFEGHCALYREQYIFCDYYYLQYCPSEEDIYVGISKITTVPADKVLPTLAEATAKLEELVRCSPKDVIIRKLVHYLHVGEILSAVSRLEIVVDDDKWSEGFCRCHINSENNPTLLSAMVKLISENFEFNSQNIRETQNGINICGYIVRPKFYIYMMFRSIAPDSEYGITLPDGKRYVAVPYKGSIYVDKEDYYEFPIPAFESKEFNYRFNRGVYPEYKNRERNELK